VCTRVYPQDTGSVKDLLAEFENPAFAGGERAVVSQQGT